MTLVEQLRFAADTVKKHGPTALGSLGPCAEAADEIERLRVQSGKLRAVLLLLRSVRMLDNLSGDALKEIDTILAETKPKN